MIDLYPTGVFCAALTPVTAGSWLGTCRRSSSIAGGCLPKAATGSRFWAPPARPVPFPSTSGRRSLKALSSRAFRPTNCSRAPAALSDTVTLTKHAIRLGVAGVVVLPPFYYKEVTVDGLMSSYEAVIERVGDTRLKVALYHIPSVAQVPIPMPLIDRLRDRYPDTVVGIKDSGGDFAHMVELVQRFPGLAVLAGADPLMLPLLRKGGSGCITATSNLAARDLATIYAGWRDPTRAVEVEAAQARISEVRAVVSHWPQIAALKSATALRTGRSGWALPRPPLMALTEGRASRATIRPQGIGDAVRRRMSPRRPLGSRHDHNRRDGDGPRIRVGSSSLMATLPRSKPTGRRLQYKLDAANIMPLKNGDFACVWFGGTQEGFPDISIYGSRLQRGASAHSPPARLSDDFKPIGAEPDPVPGSGR